MKSIRFFVLTGLAGCLLSACHTPHDRGLTLKTDDFGELKLPPNTQQPVRASDIARLIGADDKPAGHYRVQVELVRKGQGPPVVESLELKPRQSGRIGQIKEFPYPTEYLFPRIAVTKEDKANAHGPLVPLTPASFETKTLGWWCDLQLIPRGSVMELRGEFTEQNCQGFALNPGEVSSPLVDDWRTALSDNRAVAPRFTRHSSPLAVYATSGKTYRVDVNSSSRRAWLKISCEPIFQSKQADRNEVTHRSASPNSGPIRSSSLAKR